MFLGTDGGILILSAPTVDENTKLKCMMLVVLLVENYTKPTMVLEKNCAGMDMNPPEVGRLTLE